MPPILTRGLFAAYTHNLNATWHRHHLIQVNLANGDCITHLPEQLITGASVINSNVLHRVNMAAGWVLLVEPQSHYGQQLKARLQQANGMEVVLESVISADMQLNELTRALKFSGDNPVATDPESFRYYNNLMPVPVAKLVCNLSTLMPATWQQHYTL